MSEVDRPILARPWRSPGLEIDTALEMAVFENDACNMPARYLSVLRRRNPKILRRRTITEGCTPVNSLDAKTRVQPSIGPNGMGPIDYSDRRARSKSIAEYLAPLSRGSMFGVVPNMDKADVFGLVAKSGADVRLVSKHRESPISRLSPGSVSTFGGIGCNVVCSTPRSKARSNSTPCGRWLEQRGTPCRTSSVLSVQRDQVELLLHDGSEGIRDMEALLRTKQTAENCLSFLIRLEEWAKVLDMRKGQLSRLILPFDSTTSIDGQANGALLAPLGSCELDGLIPNGERRKLVASAVILRRFIRIKVADCADLNQAFDSLKLIVKFVREMQQTALEQQCAPEVRSSTLEVL